MKHASIVFHLSKGKWKLNEQMPLNVPYKQYKHTQFSQVHQTVVVVINSTISSMK